MKVRKNILRIFILCLAFVTGVSIVHYENVAPSRVYAEQHLDNYALYTYTGDYYDGFDFDAEGGMNGELRISLTTKIRPAAFYTYSGTGANYLSTVLQSADEDPTNSNNMIYFYTRDSVTKNAADTWNREHVWCQSLSGLDNEHRNWGETEGGTDILHLRPTYYSTNSSRGNTPYGDIGKSSPKYFDVSQLKVTNDSSKMLFGYCDDVHFEPLDSVKGDVARIIMYMWTTYNSWVGNKTYEHVEILNIIESYNTLLSWHTADKPDVLEGNRNNFSEGSKQQNRNPFVDHPELAWRIFGDQASANVKNACMQAYPYNVETVDPTGITLDQTNASIAKGNTLQLNATLVPNNATGSISWSSSNESVATVNNGLVTAVNEGNAVITVRVSQSVSATCSITVTAPAIVGGKIASYDFSTGNSSNSEYSSAANLLARFNSSDVTGAGLSDIVTSVSNITKTYAGYAGYYNFGLKLGTGDVNGKFTVGLNQEVSKVVVKVTGWGTSDKFTVGDAAAQTPGVAYNGNNPIKTLTYNITSSDSVLFQFTKRGFIQSIDFYTDEPITTPDGYLDKADSYAKLTANETVDAGDEATISKTIAQVSGTTTDGTKVSSLTLDSTITVSTNSNGNNGKVYSSGAQWRLYQSDNAVVTVSASDGATMSSITFTYSSTSGGILKYGNSTVTSGTPVAINDLASASFVVANSGNATNGQARVTAISVTYGSTDLTVDTIKLHFGATISKSNWDAINELDNYEITDYGIMMFRTVPERLASVSTVKQYYESDPSNVSIARKGNASVNPVDGVIDFSVIVNITRETSFRRIYCATPFIVVNDQYYFLEEIRCSVNSLASDYLTNGGSTLSNRALTYLATTSPVEE